MEKLSERALFQRVNRKLAQHGETLRKTRSGMMQIEYGDYYVFSLRHNAIITRNVDLEELAKKLKVI